MKREIKKIISLCLFAALFTLTVCFSASVLPAEAATVSGSSRSSVSSSAQKKNLKKTVQDTAEVPEEPVNIVFLGDSNYSFGRESKNSVPEQTQIIMNGFFGRSARVYNLSIGGTTACMLPGANKLNETYDPAYLAKMNGICLVNLVNILTGKAAADPLYTEAAGVDYTQFTQENPSVDWFVLGYGTNDYNGGVLATGRSASKNTYESALRYSVMRLKKYYPKAKILLCAPIPNINAAAGWNGDLVDKGGGTLDRYADVCLGVAEETGVYSLDSHRNLGINTATAVDYLADGCHLNCAGRWIYALYISNSIVNN